MEQYTKGECAFIGCGCTAKFIFETIESATDRGYGVIVEPVGTENNRAFNLYQVTPSKAKASPDLYEALKEVMQERFDDWSPLYKKIQQAILKAEGKS